MVYLISCIQHVCAGVVEWQTRRTQNPMLVTTCGFKSHHQHHKKSIGLIQNVSDLFSLQIGNFILSASNIQSLVEVPNGIFTGLFFFLYIATERKPYQRDDRCCYGTIYIFIKSYFSLLDYLLNLHELEMLGLLFFHQHLIFS